MNADPPDYIIKYPPLDAARHGYCAKCARVLPMSAFKRRLTGLEARARGYAGNVRVDVESYQCRDCQPKRKPASKLTYKEMHNRVEGGDMRVDVIPHIKEMRRLKQIEVGKKSVHKRWVGERSGPWLALIEHVKAELTSVRGAVRTAERRGIASVAAFNEAYAKVLIHTRKMLVRHRKDAKVCPHNTKWTAFVAPEDDAALRSMWARIPLAERGMGRVAALLDLSETRVPIVNRPGEHLTDRQERMKMVTPDPGTSTKPKVAPPPTAKQPGARYAPRAGWVTPLRDISAEIRRVYAACYYMNRKAKGVAQPGDVREYHAMLVKVRATMRAAKNLNKPAPSDKWTDYIPLDSMALYKDHQLRPLVAAPLRLNDQCPAPGLMGNPELA